MKYSTILFLSLVLSSCSLHRDGVRFIKSASKPNSYEVKIDERIYGEIDRKREWGGLTGHLNTTKKWLVIEDGTGGDSYPRLLVYRLDEGKMMPSKDMSDIKGSISDKPAEAIVDPIFLGFDSSGFPLIFASNTTLTIKN